MAQSKTAADKAKEAEAQKKAEAESKKAQQEAETRAQEAAEKAANEAKAQAAEAERKAAAAKAAAEASEARKAAPVELLHCIVKKVPNCGFISDNGHRIPINRVGQAMKLPKGTAYCFHEFLEVGDPVEKD